MKQGDLFGSAVSAQPGARPQPSRATAGAEPSPAPAQSPPGDGERAPPPGGGPPRAEPRRDAAAREGAAGGTARAPAGPPVEPPRPQRRVWTVSALTLAIKDLIEPPLAHVFVRGEITDFRGPNVRGHLYFSIKDAHAQLEVRVWQTLARTLGFALKNGLSVVVEGAVTVYEPSGRYSLIAQRVEPVGVGAQALALEQLKQRLAAEGLIGERRRPARPLPFLPRRIGVVTSLSGAALRDFLKVLYRRHPRLSVLVCDARVQGDGAPIEVRRALHWLARTDVDVVVVTRGGGSADDLAAFNDEALVRTIAACPVPVVSAVGHEIDTTLADLVADLRAPTPSAAAEALAPVLSELELSLATARQRLRRAMEKRLLDAHTSLRAARAGLGDPRRNLAREQLFLSEASERMARVLRADVREGHRALRELGARLQRARPQALLRERREAHAQRAARLQAALARRLRSERDRFARLALGLARASPRPGVAAARQRLAHDEHRLEVLLGGRLERARHELDALRARLDALSPLAVLGRGYAIARRLDDGRVLRRAADVRPGDGLRLRLAGEDEVTATVTGVKKGSP